MRFNYTKAAMKSFNKSFGQLYKALYRSQRICLLMGIEDGWRKSRLSQGLF